MFAPLGMLGKLVTTHYMVGGVVGAVAGGVYYNNLIKTYNLEYYNNFENIKIASSIEELLNEHWHPNLFQSANPLLQFTYLGKVYRKTINVDYDREYVKLPDGGQISLDFSKKNDKSKKKMVVLIHGQTGGSDATYMKHMVRACEKNDMNAVVFQFRGINKTPLLNPKHSHPSAVSELQVGLDKISEVYPDQEQYTIGFSLGGNYLIRYLSEIYPSSKRKFDIKVGVSVSPPFDVNDGIASISGTVYEDHFLKLQKNTLRFNEEILRGYESQYNYSYDKMIESKTLFDLYNEYSCKVHDEKGVDTFIDKFKINPDHIKNVDIPLLIMQSNDDAICRTEKVLKEEIKSNKNQIYLETETGAHICWIGGNNTKPEPFYDKIIFKYFDQVNKKSK